MAIDPKILARMRSAPPEDDGSEGAVYADEPELNKPEAPLPADKHSGCAPLTGAWKQRKWAIDLRNGALSLAWPPETMALLKSITDATWWIANKAVVHSMKFKPPSPQQTNLGVGIGPRFESTLAGVVTAATAAGALDADVVERQNRLALDAQARVLDAERWAKSVSHNPKLAEAAILAVLSRLYEGTMKTRLRIAAQEALDAAGETVAKDTDAINRMLT